MGVLTGMAAWKMIGVAVGGAVVGAAGVVASLYAWLWKEGWR